MLTVFAARSQNGDIVYMSTQQNGDTVSMVVVDGLNHLTVMTHDNTGGMDFYNDDSPSDKYITITGSCTEPNTKMSLMFEAFDLDCHDTLYVYDGGSINAPLLIQANNCMNPLLNLVLYPSMLNSTGMLTIRLKTNGDGMSGGGFSISVQCRIECETVTPVIEDKYYNTKSYQIKIN